jgi:hypothetical protein
VGYQRVESMAMKETSRSAGNPSLIRKKKISSTIKMAENPATLMVRVIADSRQPVFFSMDAPKFIRIQHVME